MFRKTDLHLHSKYSEHPSEWFLQRLGAAESYTEPEYIYNTLKARGMDFVTITDHNSIEGSLILTENHPDDTFTGVEATSYFPEDRCKIHILIYGLNEKQFNEIQRARKDIYILRDYIRDQNLPYSVAHATFPVNGKLTIEHLEKLILLFDTFEGINGGRNANSNNIWMQSLKSLSPSTIENLYSKHKIEPFSDASWIKGLTGGSDDHAGIFLGQAVTITKAENVQDFLLYIKAKETVPAGKSSDHRSFAFSQYKIACDFSGTQNKKNNNSFLQKISKFVFEQQSLEIKDKIFLNRLKAKKKKNGSNINTLLYELITGISETKIGQNDKMKLIYSKITEIINMLKSDTACYNSMRKNAEQNAADNYDLEKTFYSLFPKISIEVA